MQHVPTWLQCALLPDRWRVAGVSCNALSVWHHFVLEMMGSPYIYGQPTDKNAALELLLYCSRDYADGKRLFTQPFYRAKSVKRIAKVLRRAEWVDVDTACFDYAKTCLRVPQHMGPEEPIGKAASKPAKQRLSAAPIGWVLAQFLTGGDVSKLAQAWNTPYAHARCMFDARRDIAGEVDTLESLDEERRIDEYLAKQAEKSEPTKDGE